MEASKLFAWLLLALGAATASAQSKQLQIQFAEAVQFNAAVGHSEFVAYGRAFALELESNERLTAGMSPARKASIGNIRLLRGKLAGNPDSWVRITRAGNLVSGGVWDGTDLYLIARHRDIAKFLINPIEAAPDDTVVFRLADTTNFLPEGFCATTAEGGAAYSKNGLAQYQALVREFKLTYVASPTDQIDISLIADSGVVQAYSSPNDDVNRGMLEALNLVDGIFDAQLGLMISASDLRPLAAGVDPFTSNSSGGLLEELRAYRNSTPAVKSRALAHLFTTRVLDGGDTLGIAYLNGACDANNGVSLTSVASGYMVGGFMIMAHELGHNLGAEHDTQACGDTHLMWPYYSYVIGPTLSQCSLDKIRPFIAAHRGACISPPAYGDIVPRIGTIAAPLQTEPFTWPVYVKNTGTAALTNSVVSLSVRNYNPVPATPMQGSCSNSNGTTVCQLGTIAPGAEVRIDMNFTVNFLDTLDLAVASNATNDRYDSNNVVYSSVTVQPRATLDTSVTPASASALVGDIVTYVYTLTASGPRATSNAALQFGGDGYLQIVSATPTQGTCDTSGCSLGNIATGGNAKVTVRVKATQGDSHNLSAQTTASYTALTQQYLNAILNATATYDLAIDSPGHQLLSVGVPFTLTIPIRANGTKPITGGLFRMLLPGAVISSFDIDGVPCALNLLQSGSGSGCPLGTLNPGDVRMARLTAQFNSPYETLVYIAADIVNDELWTNNDASLVFRARHATDVTLVAARGGGNTEGVEFDAVATLRSQGAQAATNVTSTFEVPVGVRLLSATLPQGTCSIAAERRATCTLGLLNANDAPVMMVRMVGQEPATYPATWTIASANDGVPTNNSFNVEVFVGPLADVGLNPIPNPRGFIVDVPREITIEVVTGNKRAVENVVVTLPRADFLTLEAVSTPVGACVMAEPMPPQCNLGTLPPGSLIRLVARYRATRAGSGLSGWVSVRATRDVNPGNDDTHVVWNTYEAGDVSVSVSTASVNGKVGEIIDLPDITLDTVTRSNDVRFRVTLPSSVTLQSMSGDALCSSATPTTLDCYLRQQSEPGTRDVIGMKVRLDATGTFSATVVAQAANDTQPGNDSASFQVVAASATPPPASNPASGGGGGGGGGRFEWLALVFLTLLTAKRLRFAGPQPRVMSRR